MGITAYEYFDEWYTEGSYKTSGGTSWDFNALPAGSTVTRDDVKNNIYYVDSFQDVSSANISDAFDNIYEEITSSVFHPITDTTVQGEASPLTYVDFIGDYMEVKNINAVTLYGKKYDIELGATATTEPVYNEATGYYDVTKTTNYLVGSETDRITHPVMRETANLRDEVRLELISKYAQDASGNLVTVPEQELWIYINEIAMPLLSDSVKNKDGIITYTSNHDGVDDTASDTYPIRVFYEIDLSSYIIENGKINYEMIDEAYIRANSDADGNVKFYTNQFGEMNSEDADNNGNVEKGDTHTSATPSEENRYYYHQSNFNVLSDAYLTSNPSYKVKDHPDIGEYGVLYYQDGVIQEGGQDKYTAVNMTFQDLADLSDDDTVYTYIAFYRPTSNGKGAAVSYIAYSSWADLKGDIAWFDTVNNVYINGHSENSYITSADAGYVVPTSVVADYIDAKGLDDTDVIAYLGIGSWRQPRLRNMTTAKAGDNTISANATDTAELVVAPEHNDNAMHVGNLVSWLGNNGVVTVEGPKAPTGISITKLLPEAVEGAETEFQFTVNITASESFTAEFSGGSSWAQNGNTLTGTLKANETVTIVGLPEGAGYTVSESSEYYAPQFVNGSGTLVSEQIISVVATNSSKVGNLYITKEITSDGRIPDSIFQGSSFDVVVECAALANKSYTVRGIGTQDTILPFDSDGKLNLSIKARQTIEILALPASAAVTVTEILPQDSNFEDNYRSRDYSGGEARETEDEGNVTITAGANSIVNIINEYAPKPTKVSLQFNINKNLWTDNLSLLNQDNYYFDFKLEYFNGTSWQDQKLWSGANHRKSEMQLGDNQKPYVENSLTQMPIAEQSFFTTAGEYEFRLSEVIPENRVVGLTYDRTWYYITVTVEDIDGQLTVTGVKDKDGKPITDTNDDGYLDYTVTFVNKFNSAPVSIDIAKEFENESGDDTVSLSGFKFVAKEYTDATFETVKENGGDLTVVSDANGNGRMTATYNEAGDHYFVLQEINDGKDGWTKYDDTKYYINVSVVEDGSGNLTADIKLGTSRDELVSKGNATKVTFENTYDPADVQVTPEVRKALLGRDFKIGDSFTFKIYDNKDVNRENPLSDGTVIFDINSVTNSDGTLNVKDFEPLVFDKIGKFEYDIVETQPADNYKIPGVVYDTTIYDFVVEVTNDVSEGKLVANYYFEDSVTDYVTFTNQYVVSGEDYVQIQGEKQLTVENGSMTLDDDRFLFLIKDASGVEVARATNKGNTILFPRLNYTVADLGQTYSYTVSEYIPDIDSKLPGVTYDETTYTLEVEVTDDGEGNLKVNHKLYETGDTSKTALVFENSYKAEATQITIEGSKVLTGRDIVDQDDFLFALYRTDSTFAIIRGADLEVYNGIRARTPYGGGLIAQTPIDKDKFEIVLTDVNEVGSYCFAITEKQGTRGGVTYDTATYQVTVSVTDLGGQLVANVTRILKDHHAASAVAFNNSYEATDAIVPLTALKTMNDPSMLKVGAYQFGIYPAALQGDSYVKVGEAIATATNGENGLIEFRDGVFRNVGTYYFIVAEIIPDEPDANITYDESEYVLKVEIGDNYDGELYSVTTLIKGDESPDGINFVNIHTPDPIKYSLEAKKEYNKKMVGGEFKFKLASADDLTDVEQTKSNDAKGVVKFDEITFENEGVYNFTVKEVETILGFINYSVAEYEVAITVVSEEGVLRVSDVTNNNIKETDESDLTFVNNYVLDGDGKVVISGTKLINGDRTTVEDGEFEFGLYDADGKLIESVKNDADGKFTFKALKFNESHTSIDGENLFTYTIKEIAGTASGITYDDTVYTVEITVKDNDKGAVDVSYILKDVSDGKIVFTNTYNTPKPPATPETDSDNEPVKEQNSSEKSPQTGDTTNFALLLAVAFISGGLLITLVVKYRKRTNK